MGGVGCASRTAKLCTEPQTGFNLLGSARLSLGVGGHHAAAVRVQKRCNEVAHDIFYDIKYKPTQKETVIQHNVDIALQLKEHAPNNSETEPQTWNTTLSNAFRASVH